ncbi:MAG: hypothetical protein JJV93_02685 [Alphaproteobacteria bacterium]|nr:hypothetical protein [Alphaproteobacteria bacterium]MBL0718136.1 hypothetical protein [Alphaproteobacteria bacterium]
MVNSESNIGIIAVGKTQLDIIQRDIEQFSSDSEINTTFFVIDENVSVTDDEDCIEKGVDDNKSESTNKLVEFLEPLSVVFVCLDLGSVGEYKIIVKLLDLINKHGKLSIVIASRPFQFISSKLKQQSQDTLDIIYKKAGSISVISRDQCAKSSEDEDVIIDTIMNIVQGVKVIIIKSVLTFLADSKSINVSRVDFLEALSNHNEILTSVNVDDYSSTVEDVVNKSLRQPLLNVQSAQDASKIYVHFSGNKKVVKYTRIESFMKSLHEIVQYQDNINIAISYDEKSTIDDGMKITLVAFQDEFINSFENFDNGSLESVLSGTTIVEENVVGFSTVTTQMVDEDERKNIIFNDEDDPLSDSDFLKKKISLDDKPKNGIGFIDMLSQGLPFSKKKPKDKDGSLLDDLPKDN